MPRLTHSRGHVWRATGPAERRRADYLCQRSDADVHPGELAVDAPPRGHGQRRRLLRPLQTGAAIALVTLVSFHETVNCAHGLCECHFLYRFVIALTVNSLGQQTQFDKAKLDVKLMACKSTI